MREFNAAFLGAGRMGMTHLHNLVSIPGVHVRVVADTRLAAAQNGAAIVRAERASDDLDATIHASDVEVVLIGTPTNTHADLIEKCVRAGKPVWCEKPVALTLEDTMRVVGAGESSGVPVMIGFMRRFDPGYAAAKRKIDAGDVDTVVAMLRFTSGALGVLEGSRRTTWGYDIRTEIAGSQARLVIEAPQKTPLLTSRGLGYAGDHYESFPDRFAAAYRAELDYFFECLRAGTAPAPGVRDALESLRVALAATKSMSEGRPVKVAEIK